MLLVEAHLEHGRLGRAQFDERRLAGGHFNVGAAERPDICLRVQTTMVIIYKWFCVSRAPN